MRFREFGEAGSPGSVRGYRTPARPPAAPVAPWPSDPRGAPARRPAGRMRPARSATAWVVGLDTLPLDLQLCGWCPSQTLSRADTIATAAAAAANRGVVVGSEKRRRDGAVAVVEWSQRPPRHERRTCGRRSRRATGTRGTRWGGAGATHLAARVAVFALIYRRPPAPNIQSTQTAPCASTRGASAARARPKRHRHDPTPRIDPAAAVATARRRQR